MCIHNFSNFTQVSLEVPLPIRDLITLALNVDDDDPPGEEEEEVISSLTELLLSKGSMLAEYFAIEFVNGSLVSLPLLVDYHFIELTQIPYLMLGLAANVKWDEELECFHTISLEISRGYGTLPEKREHLDWILKHSLYPGFKRSINLPTSFQSKAVCVTRLESLYKVFERC